MGLRCVMPAMKTFCLYQGIHVTNYSPLGSIGPIKEAGGPLVSADPEIKSIADSLGKSTSQVRKSDLSVQSTAACC